jgi:serine protease Do
MNDFLNGNEQNESIPAQEASTVSGAQGTANSEISNAQPSASSGSSSAQPTSSDNYINHEAFAENAGQSYGNPYPVYPTPQIKSEQKPKKKRKIFSVFKLTAAALIFGIVAGAAFQGYYVIMNGINHSVGTSNNSDVKVAEVSQNSDNEATVVPATTSAGETVSDVSGIVDEVMPSIVAINATVTTTASDFFGRAYSQDAQSSGSGIIIGQNASTLLIVTNNHVIDGATSVEITFADKKTATAEVKGADSNADIAVLSVKMKDLSADTIKAIKVATLGDSSKVEAGDMAIAIGNALGYGQSVTVGYISAVNREVELENNKMTLLQTDAAINPGNSGGALLNTEGQVIGINSVKYASTEVEGMGYAIPISDAIPMINQLMNREAVSAGEQGYLGIAENQVQDVTEDISQSYNMPVGIYVNEVVKSSPAAKAGLEAGDIITGIDDFSVKTVDDLKNVLSYKKAGEEVSLKVQKKENGAYVEKSLQVTLGHK